MERRQKAKLLPQISPGVAVHAVLVRRMAQAAAIGTVAEILAVATVAAVRQVAAVAAVAAVGAVGQLFSRCV